MTVTFTERFRFGIPDFNTAPWHDDFATLVHTIDRVLYDLAILLGVSPWANNTAYGIGDVVTDSTDGTIWVCLVIHTSAVSPTTFAADRLANPTFWNQGTVITASVSGREDLVTLVDGANVALDSSLGKTFKLTAAGDRQITAPLNKPGVGEVQKFVIMHEASGANRTLSLETGVSGGFRFGIDLTGLTVTTSGLIDYIGCIWNGAEDRWDVVSYSKGY